MESFLLKKSYMKLNNNPDPKPFPGALVGKGGLMEMLLIELWDGFFTRECWQVASKDLAVSIGWLFRPGARAGLYLRRCCSLQVSQWPLQLQAGLPMQCSFSQ